MTGLKLTVSLMIILAASSIGKKFPAAAALLVVMPLTSLIVMLWLRTDNPDDIEIIVKFVRGALFGILPTVVFFLVMTICLARKWDFGTSLATGLGVWAMGALMHRFFVS